MTGMWMQVAGRAGCKSIVILDDRGCMSGKKGGERSEPAVEALQLMSDIGMRIIVMLSWLKG